MHDVAELQGKSESLPRVRGLLCMLIMRGCIGRSSRRRMFRLVEWRSDVDTRTLMAR